MFAYFFNYPFTRIIIYFCNIIQFGCYNPHQSILSQSWNEEESDIFKLT